jgi:hypothetical protein
MARIFIVAQLACAALIFMTCERANMYDLAKYGFPPQSMIYIFPAGMQPGNIGDRNNADSICYHQGFGYNILTNAATVKAFLSYSAIDELRFLVPMQYWYYPVVGISPSLNLTAASSTWIELLSGAAGLNIMASVGLAGNLFWSGSNTDGSTAIGENCSGWHDSDVAFFARYGGLGISDGITPCNNNLYLLCLAY